MFAPGAALTKLLVAKKLFLKAIASEFSEGFASNKQGRYSVTAGKLKNAIRLRR